jgi:hypothetical protein
MPTDLNPIPTWNKGGARQSLQTSSRDTRPSGEVRGQTRGQADRPKAKVSGEAGNPFEPAPSTAKVIKRRSV